MALQHDSFRPPPPLPPPSPTPKNTRSPSAQESFLEDINNVLNAGEVPNLISNDDMEAISAAMRPLMQAAGLPVTKPAIYSYFVSRVRSCLHLVLCFSPIGDVFRQRLRMFPSLVNCCTIDWCGRAGASGGGGEGEGGEYVRNCVLTQHALRWLHCTSATALFTHVIALRTSHSDHKSAYVVHVQTNLVRMQPSES